MSDHRDPAGARLDELLDAWCREIDEVPVPRLLAPVRAVDVVIEAKKRGRVPAPPDGAGTRPPGDAREEAF
ncbi:hypothetical protein [Amycolatopsis sp. NPDC051371]|uniref:hypothetical protein n=1 Tax=Amycolatopsis sp. NPDC051371 TaxID=3155800 RepID=UPI003419D682